MRAYSLGLIVILAGCMKPSPPVVAVPPVEIPPQPLQPPPAPPPTAEERTRADNERAAEEKLRAEEGLRQPTGDPHALYTLEEATRTLPGSGPITATIKTTLGDLTCRLLDDKAPFTVANFIGLARGTRQWKTPEGAWVQRPLYDGTTFHRVIKGFMIQGGDPKGNGTGEPGYVFPDEMWKGAKHDRAGLLCMANRGPNTNGAQFFITDGSAPHLDSGYTIFGECSPVSVVHAIANTPVTRDRPTTAVVIDSVTITR